MFYMRPELARRLTPCSDANALFCRQDQTHHGHVVIHYTFNDFIYLNAPL